MGINLALVDQVLKVGGAILIAAGGLIVLVVWASQRR